MDRYQLGFEIARLVCMSNEPLEEIKYLTRILRQMHHMYLDRERIRYCVDNQSLWSKGDTKSST